VFAAHGLVECAERRCGGVEGVGWEWGALRVEGGECCAREEVQVRP
jgi:hypothetical protein